jgi:hypothetical protein
VRVQATSAASQVRAGHKATFVVWVWSAKEASYGASVRASIGTAKDVDAPGFMICPVPDGTTCRVGNLPVGQVDELETAVDVQSKAALGEQVTLTAAASAKGSLSDSGSATDVVVLTPTVSPTLPGVTLPPTSLPPIPGTATSPSNPAGLFPTVPPSTSPSTSTPGFPRVRPHSGAHPAVAAASATVPVDARLIGGQLAGLAVLAGAIAIAVVRLSLRRPRAHDPAGKSQQPKSQ